MRSMRIRSTLLFKQARMPRDAANRDQPLWTIESVALSLSPSSITSSVAESLNCAGPSSNQLVAVGEDASMQAEIASAAVKAKMFAAGCHASPSIEQAHPRASNSGESSALLPTANEALAALPESVHGCI